MSYNAKRETPPRMPDAPANRCSAHGCPLRATIFDSVIGPPQLGRCRYHDAALPRDWPYLTELLCTNPFTREALEPGFASIALRWQEPEPPTIGEYHSAHTGVTVRDAASFKRWWSLYSTRPPIVKHSPTIGSFVRVGALTIRDREWDEERAAIQAESDPL